MKTLIVLFTLAFAQASFASNTLKCANQDGEFQLVPTAPCQHCNPSAPAFSFIGGEGVIDDDIPSYEADMPGYIDFDAAQSKSLDKDVISLIDGGTWTIDVEFPKDYFSQSHAIGEKVEAIIDSTYSDTEDSELTGIKLTCTVQ